MAGDIKRRVSMLKHWVQVADVLPFVRSFLILAMSCTQQFLWFNVDHIGTELHSYSSTKTDLGTGPVQNDDNFRRTQ